jgi:uncharacterized membrane protein
VAVEWRIILENSVGFRRLMPFVRGSDHFDRFLALADEDPGSALILVARIVLEFPPPVLIEFKRIGVGLASFQIVCYFWKAVIRLKSESEEVSPFFEHAMDEFQQPGLLSTSQALVRIQRYLIQFDTANRAAHLEHFSRSYVEHGMPRWARLEVVDGCSGLLFKEVADLCRYFTIDRVVERLHDSGTERVLCGIRWMCCAVLCCAVLCWAVLCCAGIEGAREWVTDDLAEIVGLFQGDDNNMSEEAG